MRENCLARRPLARSQRKLSEGSPSCRRRLSECVAHLSFDAVHRIAQRTRITDATAKLRVRQRERLARQLRLVATLEEESRTWLTSDEKIDEKINDALWEQPGSTGLVTEHSHVFWRYAAEYVLLRRNSGLILPCDAESTAFPIFRRTCRFSRRRLLFAKNNASLQRPSASFAHTRPLFRNTTRRLRMLARSPTPYETCP